MTLGQLLILYLLAGAAVAIAVYVTTKARTRVERAFQVATAVVFWPLYLTLLLSKGGAAAPPPVLRAAPAEDDLARAIAQVDAELEAAFDSLGGWAEGVLVREKGRLDELRSAWAAQAQHVRDIDRLLARIDAGPDDSDDADPSERVRASRLAVQQNTARLRLVRQRTHQGLVETLAWVRELVSMIHLAKFTGAPASRAEDLVGQIAAAVEGLSAVTWQDAEPIEQASNIPRLRFSHALPTIRGRLEPDPQVRGAAMFRQCSHCGEPFTAHDLCKDVSKELEAQRMAAGVDGVLVRVYTCSHCQKDDVFVDVCALPGESEEAMHKRKEELESVVRQLPASDADVVLAERPLHKGP